MHNEQPAIDTRVERGRDVADNGSFGNLKVRIASGLVLAVAAVLFCYLGTWPFALLVGIVAVLMSWEWGRVVRGAGFDTIFFIHAAFVAAAALMSVSGYAALGLSLLAIGAFIIIPLKFGDGSLFSALGVFYVGVPTMALLWLRSDEPFGFLAVIFIFLTVWTMDTFAFITGRAVGGPKLWPAVSPKKTWAGLIGGMVASGVAGGLLASAIGAPVMQLASIGLFLGLVAQGGDLAESALKRFFGVKDASSLIPGHGGFLDRMDSFVPVAVAAALIALAVNVGAPARALLFGA